MRPAFLAAWLVLAVSAPAAGSDRYSTLDSPDGPVFSDLVPALPDEPQFSWSADPFLKPPGYIPRAEVENEEFALQGTILEGSQPTAIVNDRVVRVGDRVGTRKVRKIGEDFVLLEKGGSVIELGLYEHSPEEASRAPASQPSSEPEILIEEVKK